MSASRPYYAVCSERILQQARYLYLEIQAHSYLTAAITPFGITPETVVNRLIQLDELAEATQEQQRQSAQDNLATQRRQAAMAVLDDWMSDFLNIARIVFRRNPAQLKKLGLPIRG